MTELFEKAQKMTKEEIATLAVESDLVEDVYGILHFIIMARMEDKSKLEIVETLVDICFVLEGLAKYSHTNTRFLRNHAEELAMLSAQYRKKIIPKEEEKEDVCVHD